MLSGIDMEHSFLLLSWALIKETSESSLTIHSSFSWPAK